jgi:DNA-damage-inducible protein J
MILKKIGGTIMANTLIQFREDEEKRLKAVKICEQLGTDLITYLRICIERLNVEEGFPFSMTIEKRDENPGIVAMKRASSIAEEYGISDMTLEEINAEIAESRRQSR